MDNQEFNTRNILRFDDAKPNHIFEQHDFFKNMEKSLSSEDIKKGEIRRGIANPVNSFSYSNNHISGKKYDEQETVATTLISTRPSEAVSSRNMKGMFYTVAAILIITVVMYYLIRKRKKDKETEDKKKSKENNWGEFKFMNTAWDDFKETDSYKILKELASLIFILSVIAVVLYVLAFVVKGVRKVGDQMFSSAT